MLAFSTVDRDSFEAIESWKRKVGLIVIDIDNYDRLTIKRIFQELEIF